MTYVDSFDCKGLRAILCMRFDKHASPDQVSEFKAAVINSAQTLHSVETTGSLDFIVEVAPPTMASLNEWLNELAGPLSMLVEHCEKSFVCRRFIRRPKGEDAIWVPAGEGFQRIDSALIDKIAADGDYVHVHSGQQQWLVHATMRAMLAKLSSKEFVQLHRSLVVRWGFVDRLVHDGRHWKASLVDGSIERVAKSHLPEVLARRRLPVTPRRAGSPLLSSVRHGLDASASSGNRSAQSVSRDTAPHDDGGSHHSRNL